MTRCGYLVDMYADVPVRAHWRVYFTNQTVVYFSTEVAANRFFDTLTDTQKRTASVEKLSEQPNQP